MGQQYLGGAILNKYERLFVQSVGLSILYGESARVSSEEIKCLPRLLTNPTDSGSSGSTVVQ